MARDFFYAIGGAIALVGGLALTPPAAAQNIGDVGIANGNVYTFVPTANGRGVWRRGRIDIGPSRTRTILAERYIPTIWTDPDGCEHWVMDDGAEGYMTPHVNQHGRPVCARPAARKH